jgi:hypothetical protein
LDTAVISALSAILGSAAGGEWIGSHRRRVVYLGSQLHRRRLRLHSSAQPVCLRGELAHLRPIFPAHGRLRLVHPGVDAGLTRAEMAILRFGEHLR